MQLCRPVDSRESFNSQGAWTSVTAPPELRKETGDMHILLVEDDEDDRRLVDEFLLTAHPCEFSVESVGTLAAALARLSAIDISAVLLDLFLPDSEGFETFTQIHVQFPNLPIVILTGLADEGIGMRAVSAGAQDYLTKSNLSPEILIRSLRYALERKQAEQRLRQSQKMEALGHLAGGIAHDFNNLLGVILGNAEILQDCALKGDVPPRAVQRIREAAKSAVSLIDQLLAFSRRQSLKSAVLNLNDIVEHEARLLRDLIRESITLDMRLDPAAGCVRADRGQIEQVILNLAVNARDAMSRGGTLTIETSNMDVHDGHFAGAGRVDPGRYVMLSVTDTGAGMDAETQARMFEPFYTTKEHGTGLGLATVGGIVAQSGGYISVRSKLGHGTTIRILFPRVEEQLASNASVAALKNDTGASETILLVEDNLALREVAREFLAAGGYTVLEAGSPDEALSKTQRYHGTIHLLLTDVVLPSGNGRQVAAELRSLRPEIAVLYMSGYTVNVISDHDVVEPGHVLLQKPFTKKQLLCAVRETLDARKAKGMAG